MADYTRGEQALMAKWWGRRDLAGNDEFWGDVLSLRQEEVVPLPIDLTLAWIRRLGDWLDCPPGKCATCCRYQSVGVSAAEAVTLRAHKPDLAIATGPAGALHMVTSGGCPFLLDGVCSIYNERPDVCHHYPIQGTRQVTADGKSIQQVLYRIKCPASIRVIRRVVDLTLKEHPGHILLPDLSLIAPYKEAAKQA